jgi:hypothetical protein
MENKDWIEVGKAALLLLGAVVALWQYRIGTNLKKAEWIESLHSKFFESDTYKNIRRILDYESQPDFANLKTGLSDGSADHGELCESFVDYLNFFEFIASLGELNQLTKREIFMLFDYYLHLLHRHEFIRCYIREQGFESLEKLLDSLTPKPVSTPSIERG